ncbi:MAG: signal peptide peptidase SppA [Lachnospiraceae bacterium]
MNRKQIVGAIVATVLFIIIGITSVFTNVFSSSVSKSLLKDSAKEILTGNITIQLPASDYIGVVKVEGIIQEQSAISPWEEATGYQHATTLEYMDKMMEDQNNKGILLYIDSPGGAVYESEELCQKIKAYQEKTKRPVWTYMAHYAASGGYYIAAPSDKIYANPNTTTGSIGVIISGYDMSGLYDKLGIKAYSVTSGVNKDMSAPTKEQLAIYQSVVDEAYQQFVNVVATGRDMSQEEVRVLADGRIYSALQAKGNGLIDEIALYDDMKTQMEEAVKTTTFYELPNNTSVIASLFNQVQKLAPKSEAEVLTDISEKYESGVPMYYAEPR